ncbi:protein wings apart-like [Anopheles aquasalis]|uniref:protein wings apart-like n=1 Tax=Anopheles aquasalis TaxID=42839 RepID=UPI00215B6791|nr:protein wings apart-like [Anopheles aquasalis]XP_050099059.1 protein wings apart-like [Anopheles aquasalis]XP_050099060.1 protein wings apart-like [Anopheles aquasalis]
MPKWNKPHGVIVPLDSLLKERRKENCPAPRRSAGLVGRWGITSFTSIRNRSFVSEYNNVDMMEPSSDVGVARDSTEALSNLLSPVAQEPARPRKFFKSRNILPPPLVVPSPDNAFQQHHHLMMAAGDGSSTIPALSAPNAANAAVPHPDELMHTNNRACVISSSSTAQVAPSHYYQPLSAAATPQFSPTGPQSANVVGGGVVLPPQSTDTYAAQHRQQHLLEQHDQLLQSSEPIGGAVVSSKSSSRRKKQSPEDAGRRSKGSNKKEKKEKKAKKSKAKEPSTSRAAAAPDQPKRNSSRIQNRIINYNEDDDSNDYQLQRQQQKMALQIHLEQPEVIAERYSPDEDQHPEVSQSIQPAFQCDTKANCSPTSDSLAIEGGRTGSRPTTTVPTPLASPSIGEHRPILLRISKGTSMLISTDSEDISSNSASAPVASDYQAQQKQQQQPPTSTGNSDTTTVDQFASTSAHYHPALTGSDGQSPSQQHHQPLHDGPYQHRYAEEGLIGEQQQLEQQQPNNIEKEGAVPAISVPVAVPKTDLKIKISLGGKPMVGTTTTTTSATTTSSPTTAGASPTVGSTSATASSAKGNKTCRYNFKKRAIEQERARHHLSSKRSRAAATSATEPKTQGDIAEWFEPTAAPQQQSETTVLSALFQPSHSATGTATGTRPVFPLPGTDTYEVFRTLSSLSGGEDFDSQSSILGSASSDNNTPKHTLPAGEGDHHNHHQQQQPHCQIIHSRGSSDCGSDLELSQNSSTVAAPPSDAYSENENTQDINPRPPLATAPVSSSPINATRTAVAMATTPLVAAGNTESSSPSVVPPPATERVEVLKLSLKNVSSRSAPTYSRVTRNKTKTPGTEGGATEAMPLDAGNVSPQSLRSSATVTRSVRSRATNNNSNHNNNNNNNTTVVGSSAIAGGALETTIKAKKVAKGSANASATSNGDGTQKKVTQQQQQQRQDSSEFELPMKPAGQGAPSANLGGDGLPEPQPDALSKVQSTEKILSSTGNVAAATTTRQYSRRKKNVVPPDYLPELSSATLPGGGSMTDGITLHEQQDVGVLDLGAQRGLGSGSDLESKSIITTSATQLMSDLFTDPLREQPSHYQNARSTEVPMESGGGTAAADGGTADEMEANSMGQPVAANTAELQPPAPMRLVLQKKGSIFKSRPLVGSSDGAPEAKKRHVYKHKWDDDDEDNGRMRDSRSCSTAVVVPSDGVDGLDTVTSGGSAGIAGNSTSGVGTVGIGGSSGAGVIVGDMLDDPCAPITGEGATGTGAMPTVVGGSAVGGGIVGADAGTGPADSNGDLLECDASLSSLPGGLGARAKRANKQSSSGGVGLAAGGSGGPGASGVGTSTSSTNSNCFGVDPGFGGANGLPGMNTGGSGNSGGYYPAGSAQSYDSEGAGFGGDWDNEYGGGEQMPSKIRCYRDSKPFYTIVRNVKNSHQMQEIGEFQEMDDDVEYILSALQPDNPMSTRCLSALQLATKCMKPAFKMHVRAHGVVTRFFRALSDAHQDAGLALCTAAIMYVFSQDKLNMDLDRDSLELMLNLLGTTSSGEQLAGPVGKAASDPQQKIRQRVKELCEEIKGSGKAKAHIIGGESDSSGGSSGNGSDGHRISAATLAMESLLSLTSQRAGEWFKDELRKLGGIEHLIKTVSECYESVPERAADWHPEAIAKLRKIERCLRVLNNVCVFNRANQTFLLEHRDGLLVQLLARIYRQLDREIPFHPTDDHTPKAAVGVVVRELHQPILHMLITLTHSFDDQAPGATLVGQQPEMIDMTMHVLLRIARYVPSRCVFDLNLLALTLLLHLARPSEHNRQQILRYKASEGKQSGIKELVEYFEQQEEMASHAEAKTNAILETPARTVDTEDTETRLIQKAEHHMEHTYMGSHVGMLIFYLIADQPSLEQIARAHLLNGNFKRMVAAMSRYYEFLNLTTNADAESTAHKRQTKKAIDYLSRLDGGVCDASTSLQNSIAQPTPS